MCEKCAKTFTSDANLQCHFKTETQFEKGDSTEDKPARRFFENNPEDVSDGEENIIKMPVTNTKDLNTLIHVVCEKRGVDRENIKLMLGGWNIEQMLRDYGYHPLNGQMMRSI